MTRVHFGPFVLDQETRELRRGNEAVDLSPKAFELLRLLVASRPRALSKSELQDQLWPDTFVVEKNLSNLVGEIRTALGDDPRKPIFVRTVTRFGYAFRDDQPAPSHDGTSVFLRWAQGRVELGVGEHVVGRDPDAQVLLNSPGVSRRHALIKVSEGSATVEDLGSKNGTFVGEQRLTGRQTLSDGDIIRVGADQLTVRIVRAPASTETQVAH